MFASFQRHTVAKTSNASKLAPVGNFSQSKQILRTGRLHSGISISGYGAQVQSMALENKQFIKHLHRCINKTYGKHLCCAENKTHQKLYSGRWPVLRILAQFLKLFVSSQTFICINFRKLLVLNIQIKSSWKHSLQGIKPVKISCLCQLECIEYILCGCKFELFTAVGDTVPTTGWKRSKETDES